MQSLCSRHRGGFDATIFLVTVCLAQSLRLVKMCSSIMNAAHPHTAIYVALKQICAGECRLELTPSDQPGCTPELVKSQGHNMSGTGLLLYTSGTTGLPKGVAQQEHQSRNRLSLARGIIGYTSRDTVYLPVPMTSATGLMGMHRILAASADGWQGSQGSMLGLSCSGYHIWNNSKQFQRMTKK